MSVSRFYYQQTIEFEPGLILQLAEDESRHACKSLRLKIGDPLLLFNGDGREYQAILSEASAKAATVELKNFTESRISQTPRLTIASAVPKTGRESWMIQKLTELEVHGFVPLVTEHSVVVPGEGKQKRWQQLVIEAAKQCGRCTLMEISPRRSLEQLLQEFSSGWRVIQLHPNASVPLKDALEEARQEKEIAILIGPEGGWSEAEMEAMDQAEVRPAKFGDSILRTETAAIAAAAAVRLMV